MVFQGRCLFRNPQPCALGGLRSTECPSTSSMRRSQVECDVVDSDPTLPTLPLSPGAT